MPRPVVLDVDTGLDDACAILLAARHPDLDLLAVSCVGGNAPLSDVVANTLTVLDAAGRPDVVVAAGADRPLLERPAHARHVHGEDGLGDLDWPRSTRSPDPRPAVDMLRDVLLAAPEPVTLVTLAPLTNIALLLRTHPEVAGRIGDLVVMGGAVDVGNATASAEFNVFHDPEAAAIAFDAAADLGISLTLYGLDVFYGPTVTLEQARVLAASDEPATRLAGLLIEVQCRRFERPQATIGDAGAVCAVLDRGALRTETLPLRVELGGSWSRGRTVVDRRSWAGDMSHDPHGMSPVVVDVALDVDGPRYASLWLRTVGG
jgi:inosine-uridine nucleoside N-ribohydrolase